MMTPDRADPGPRNRAAINAVAVRCTGPGGYYNLGNALGLTAGIAFQALAARGEAHASFIDIVWNYFVGSPGATALSIAMVMFFASGELYHRAWTSAAGPDALMIRRADLLSGVAALILAASLALFGSLWLALVSTILLAGGKLGSALSQEGRWPVRVEFLSLGGATSCRKFDLFRLAPVLSRLPAIFAILIEITRLLLVGTSSTALHLSQSVVLLMCYLLWGRADLLLLRH